MGGDIMKDIHEMMKELILNCDDSQDDDISELQDLYQIPESQRPPSDYEGTAQEYIASQQMMPKEDFNAS